MRVNFPTAVASTRSLHIQLPLSILSFPLLPAFNYTTTFFDEWNCMSFQHTYSTLHFCFSLFPSIQNVYTDIYIYSENFQDCPTTTTTTTTTSTAAATTTTLAMVIRLASHSRQQKPAPSTKLTYTHPLYPIFPHLYILVHSYTSIQFIYVLFCILQWSFSDAQYICMYIYVEHTLWWTNPNTLNTTKCTLEW